MPLGTDGERGGLSRKAPRKVSRDNLCWVLMGVSWRVCIILCLCYKPCFVAMTTSFELHRIWNHLKDRPPRMLVGDTLTDLTGMGRPEHEVSVTNEC